MKDKEYIYIQGDTCPECCGCLRWTESEDYEEKQLQCDECGFIALK